MYQTDVISLQFLVLGQIGGVSADTRRTLCQHQAGQCAGVCPVGNSAENTMGVSVCCMVVGVSVTQPTTVGMYSTSSTVTCLLEFTLLLSGAVRWAAM
jgi:vacuolar-type H+-ATPase subunit D/Vma8